LEVGTVDIAVFGKKEVDLSHIKFAYKLRPALFATAIWTPLLLLFVLANGLFEASSWLIFPLLEYGFPFHQCLRLYPDQF
jgi:hypothetical protein